MKCEDCLTLVEEYFDGELGAETEGRVAAHLSACADCSEALDALAEEQSLYARYERGVEPTPALWQAVSARIAAADEANSVSESFAVAARESFVARLRAAFASVFVLPRFNPALAGSLALVAVTVFAGWLWLTAPPARTPTVARNESPAARKMPEIQDDRQAGGQQTGDALARGEDSEVRAGGVAPAPGRQAVASRVSSRITRGSGASVPAAEAEGAVINHEHPTPDVALAETVAFTPPAGDAGAAEFVRRQVDSLEDREVARHLERARLLLRTFNNVADSPDEAAEDIAYEKRLSQELLSENIMLRRESETSGRSPARRVLDTLEPFLLDIANLEDKPSKEDVRAVKERMQKKEIIAALHVYD